MKKKLNPIKNKKKLMKNNQMETYEKKQVEKITTHNLGFLLPDQLTKKHYKKNMSIKTSCGFTPGN